MSFEKSFNYFICILLTALLIIYHWAFRQIWQIDEPMWLVLKLKDPMINSPKVILEIRLNRNVISLNESFIIIATLINKSAETYYFGEKWFESGSIGTNMYDINKKKFICDYSASKYGSYFDKKNPKHFLLKPNEKKEFRKTFVLKKGFLMLWRVFPWFNYYLFDGNDTYIVLKGKKTVFIRLFYSDYSKKIEQDEIKLFRDFILSNKVKISIK